MAHAPSKTEWKKGDRVPPDTVIIKRKAHTTTYWLDSGTEIMPEGGENPFYKVAPMMLTHWEIDENGYFVSGELRRVSFFRNDTVEGPASDFFEYD